MAHKNDGLGRAYTRTEKLTITPAEMRAGLEAARMKDEPLTEEELADILTCLHYEDGIEKFPECWGLGVAEIERLVAEVRRLRAELLEVEDEAHLDRCPSGVHGGCEECAAIKSRRDAR